MPTVMPEVTSTEFKPTGGINVRDRSATFDQYRVRGPRINLARRTDGSWGGTVKEQPIDVTVDENTIRGVDLLLNRSDSKPGHVVITGQFQGSIMRFEFDEKEAKVRSGSLSNSFAGRVEKDGVTKYGPSGPFVLTGEAGTMPPTWPQVGFALLGVFN